MTTKEALSRNAFLHVDNIIYADIKPAGVLEREITWSSDQPALQETPWSNWRKKNMSMYGNIDGQVL
jgi:hypothetical protein